jgi:hypothetical protein
MHLFPFVNTSSALKEVSDKACVRRAILFAIGLSAPIAVLRLCRAPLQVVSIHLTLFIPFFFTICCGGISTITAHNVSLGDTEKTRCRLLVERRTSRQHPLSARDEA